MNYKIWFHLLSVLWIQCFTVCLAMASRNLTDDQFALLEFKHRIIDPNNVLTNNWTISTSVCNWVGVSCGVIHKRVIALNLPLMNLTGVIPPHVGNLSFLNSLDLDGNYFYGHLPKELGQLHRLRLMDLSFNSFNGEIPSSIGKCNKLQHLVLDYNELTGIIPRSIGNLTQLRRLDLGPNNLHGEIPEEIGNLGNLEGLFMQYLKGLTGRIPASIFNISSLISITFSNDSLSGHLPDDLCHRLPNLRSLYLAGNKLSGNIPSSINECYTLRVLELSSNQFTGTIPYSLFNSTSLLAVSLFGNNLEGSLPPITNVPKLWRLVVWGNKLSGNIPNSISNASMLESLDLGDNFFSSQIPNTLGNLRHLEFLQVANNHLTTDSTTHEWSFLSSLVNCKNLSLIEVSANPLKGVLPAYVGNLSTSLRKFLAMDCELKGSIPMEIGNLRNLLRLELANNGLSGSIPTSIGRLENLQALSLSSNELEGSISESICGLQRLYALYLGSNKLHGSIPPCLGDLTSLRYLHLDSNNFSSAIPLNLWNLKDVLELDLSSNYLNNSHALDVGDLRSLFYLNLSRNLLTGDISSSFGGLQTLVQFDLSNNRFHGHIPGSLGRLISLEFLDLSNNNLSGVIPESLEKLAYLHYFNVSFNRLEGEIPNNGCFSNFSSTSFMENYELCGPPRLLVPPCKGSIHKSSSKTRLHALRYGLPAIGIVLLLVVLTIMYRKCQSRSTGTALPVKDDSLSLKITRRRISQAELSLATSGFDESKMLGFGSFGYVYEGRLADGTKVAVKVFDLQTEGAFRSFDVECEAMCNIVHRNLVKVITCCSNVDFKALVLDFMPNGSLDKWLHSANCFLDLLQRVDIMIDVATALEHLHSGHPTPIIHCDIKLSNILLDEDMVAHVGDFGIAKLLGEGDVMKQTMTLATIGYMAPEFGSAGIVSVKCDVYSYGIVLIETFTKKKPTDEIFAEDMTIRHWTKRSISKGMVDIADVDLLSREDEYFVVKANCISSILELALDCSAELPEERRDMKDVVTELKKIKQRFLNSIQHV